MFPSFPQYKVKKIYSPSCMCPFYAFLYTVKNKKNNPQKPNCNYCY